MAKYHIKYTAKAEEDIKKFKKAGNKLAENKIKKLLKEIADHPRTGTGHPEPLKYRPYCWSRRITKEHRLVYEIQDDVVVVLVLAAYGHYDDN